MAMMEGFAGVGHVGQRREAAQEAGVDGSGGLAMELLVDDGFGEGLKRALFWGDTHGEGADAGDEPGELGIGGRDRGDRGRSVVGRGLRASWMRAGHGEDDTAFDFLCRDDKFGEEIDVAAKVLDDFRSIIVAVSTIEPKAFSSKYLLLYSTFLNRVCCHRQGALHGVGAEGCKLRTTAK